MNVHYLFYRLVVKEHILTIGIIKFHTKHWWWTRVNGTPKAARCGGIPCTPNTSNNTSTIIIVSGDTNYHISTYSYTNTSRSRPSPHHDIYHHETSRQIHNFTYIFIMNVYIHHQPPTSSSTQAMHCHYY